MNLSEIPPRLRWACRRGMLELDIFLGRFLEEAYLGLTEADQETFHRLLECNDQELFNWLTDKNQTQDAELASIIEKVRQHAKNRY